MFLNKDKVRTNKRGYFTAIILAILILTILGILAQQIANHKMENETVEQLIITKHITEERALFEYNTKNIIKSYLDPKIKETQDIENLKPVIDLILKQYLQENNFPSIFNSELGINVQDCDVNICVYYDYVVLNQLKKTTTYESKSIEIKIPDNYSIANIVVIG